MPEPPSSPWHAAHDAYYESLGWPPHGRPWPFRRLPRREWEAWKSAGLAACAYFEEVQRAARAAAAEEKGCL